MRQGPAPDQHRPGLRLQALAGPARRDRRGALPADLPLPDRHPLQVRRPDAGQAHAGLPLDERLRRFHAGACRTP
ncbi:MAG: hypothetical protein MZV64_63655 [Ignavibacteriales bacterium]|nr:hypothetical protein [Ignavibacteriales bacterium]